MKAKQLIINLIIIYLSGFYLKAQNNIFPVHSPENGKWGFINEKGITLIPFVYEFAGIFSEGLAGVKQNEKCGYINEKGANIIPFMFETANPFSEGMAAVMQNGKYGFIDKKGQMIVKPEFEYAEAFTNGQAYVYKDKTSQYINKTGEFIVPVTDNPADFVDGLAPMEKDGRYGYVNTSGKFVIEPVFFKANRFYQGRAEVQFDEKTYAFIDKKGNILFKTAYMPWSKFYEGLACVLIDQKIGFIDTTGKLVIKNIYSTDIREPIFSDGLCKISLDGKTVVIDKTGKVVKELGNDEYISDFHEGFAILSNYSGSCAYINKNGEIVTDFKYKEAHDFSEGLAVAVTNDGDFEIIDTKGNVIAKLPLACTDVGTDFKYKNGVCVLQTNVSPDSNMVVPANTDNPNYIKQWGGVADIWVDKAGKIVWKGAPWYSCFPTAALVTMADGTQKEIQKISFGDLVVSYNSVEDKISETMVTEVQSFNGKSHLYKIIFSAEDGITASLDLTAKNNHYLEVTAMHPLLTPSGIKRVKELVMGDILFYKNPINNKIEKVKIEQISINESIVNEVFQLKTASGNYLVNGIVVLFK